jgi:hypothetical protein
MQKISNVTDLKIAIRQLEFKQANEWPILKDHFHHTYESLKPLTLLKNTFKEFTTLPEVKDNIAGTLAGLTAGFLSKALVTGASHHPVKRLLGTMLQLGVTNVVSRNPEAMKSMAGYVVNFFKKKEEEKIDNN